MEREIAAPSIKVPSLVHMCIDTLSTTLVLDRPIASSVIPIRQVPSAPPIYTLPRHASTSHLEQKRPASPKKNRRFSFMPSKKDTSQSFFRSPLRHSLRELSSHKKEQSGSLPDFTQFTAGKNKNMNFNNSNNTDKNNLVMVARVTVTPPKLNSNNNNNTDVADDDDLMHTQSESLLTASSSISLGDGDLEQSSIQRSSSSDNLRVSNNGKQEKPRLRDSAEGLDHKHFIVRGLCLGSYSLFHKGGNK